MLQISRFVASHIGLNSNLAAIEKEIAEAEKAAREEARKKHKTGNGGKRAADSTTTTAPPLASINPETESQQTRSLFDQESGANGEAIEISQAAGQTEYVRNS